MRAYIDCRTRWRQLGVRHPRFFPPAMGGRKPALFFVIPPRFLYLSRTMTDPRYTKLAKLLVEYSTALKKGDRVLLDMIDVPDEFTIELVRAARKAGAIPLVETRHTRVGR